ncbi:MAG TPA: glycosyl hydrolase [Longimicrobium sp.]
MIRVWVLAGLVATGLAACAPAAPEDAPPPAIGPAPRVAPPPAGSLYHGVYPGGTTGYEDDITPATLASYEQHVQKSAAWVYFSHNWFRGRAFPTDTARWIRDRAGSIPYVRLMMRSDRELDPDSIDRPAFPLHRIARGDYDGDLRAWARAARDFGTPILAEFGTEMNGRWFPWNAVHNGDSRGARRFREAYRRIIRIAREEGAHNVTWVFHVNHQDYPARSWNRFEEYYPGDAWIDWIGVSVYGAQKPTDTTWPQFRPLMDAVYPRLTALSSSKPIVLLEFGADGRNPLGDQARWAEDALRDLVGGRWPRLIGFSWWNERWPNDDDPSHDTIMRVQDNPALAAVFQRWVGGQASVLGRVRTTP